MFRLFHRMIVRPIAREPLRTSLIVLAVALGVAVVLAIELAGEAAAGSFRSSIETLAGDADFEITAVGGVPASVAGTLATLPYPLRIKPRLEDYATVTGTAEVVPFIGVDMVAGALEGIIATDSFDATAQRDVLLASEDFQLQPGEKITLQIQDRIAEYTIGGIFKQRGRVLVADLALAEKLFRRESRLDRILVWVPKEPSLEQWETRLRSALPPGVTLAFQGTRTRENRRMLEAFRWNLRVLSYIALVVGAFLIYNTISVSVVRRRAEIGILRALGATRATILGAFLGEAALFGFAGGILGLFLGRLMAEGAVKLVGSTVESLYVSSKPAPIVLSAGAAILALAIGVSVSFFSALSPAHEAARVPPTEAMARGRSDYLSRVRRGRSLAIAALFAALAWLASRLAPIAEKPVGGYAAALLLIGAAALAIPACVDAISRATSGVMRVIGVEPLLAMRSLAGSLRRTSVLIGALTTAIAMMVSVGIMVGSFRQTVILWMENQLKADLYLRPAGPASADRFPVMTAELPDRIAALPMVRAVDRFRAYAISYNGLPVTLGGGESRAIDEGGRAEFLSGNRHDILRKLPVCDCVIVSEPFANKHRVAAGDRIHLPLSGVARPFEVLGIYYDYANERGYVIMDRAVLLKYLPDPTVSNLAIWLRPGSDLDEAKRAVQQACAGSNVIVLANRTLRAEAIKIFDRTFAITYALEAIAAVVAVMGVAGALLALVIDRRRELGMLRFLGAAKAQIRRMILWEAALIGLIASAAGLLVGALLSLILVFVINKQSFGWTIQFHWPVAVLAGALLVVFAATLIAGFYPARVATALNPIEVVHEE